MVKDKLSFEYNLVRYNFIFMFFGVRQQELNLKEEAFEECEG
jgi:hypothetical protein